MKHSPTIALASARRELEAAREECPHWDYDSDGCFAECCYRVDAAKNAVRKANYAVIQGKVA